MITIRGSCVLRNVPKWFRKEWARNFIVNSYNDAKLYKFIDYYMYQKPQDSYSNLKSKEKKRKIHKNLRIKIHYFGGLFFL